MSYQSQNKSEEEKKKKWYNNIPGFKAWLSPKYNSERLMFTIQRVTGFILVLYIYVHIIITGLTTLGQSTWNYFLSHYDLPIFEVIIAMIVGIHGLNGIRLIITELGYSIGKPAVPEYPYKPKSLTKQKMLMYALMIVAAIFIIVAAWDYIVFLVR
ncbi:MAG: hypothetical protein OWQ54_00875 [Sulfolobaceae archaeon]|nr:hypothetical protein [Sulfolobaceae archaeon]